MKYPLLSIFSFLWSTIAVSQDTKLVVKKFTGSKQPMETYYVFKSDGQTKHGEYISYFPATDIEYRQIKDGVLELDRFVKQKGSYINGKKNGEWIDYSRPSQIRIKGSYSNDEKVGIWFTSKENGQVWERFDHDNNKKLPPIISINKHYPKSAQEAGLEGKVIVSFQTHMDCSISDIKITQSLSNDCDKVALDAIKRFAELLKKYGVDCSEATQAKEVVFVPGVE